MSARAKKALDELRTFGLSYPEAHLKSPWPNHADLALDDKTFAYLPPEPKPFSISCRLPHSSRQALELPFCEPTGYGLGKWGWVTATIEKGPIPVDLFQDWIDESYRTQAKAKRLRELDPGT